MTQTLKLRYDAVLPVIRRDWPRVDWLLMPTLDAYATGLQSIWVIVPQEDFDDAILHFRNPRFIVLSELDLLPELGIPDYGSPRLRRWNRGWWVQQLAKLAAARLVSTDWYLPIDADCLLGRPLRNWDLVRNGKLVVRFQEAHHRNWYGWADKVLELPRSGKGHGVTPAPMLRQSVFDLFDYLSNKYEDDAERVLMKKFPWTEYALYYSFLEGSGSFNIAHQGGWHAIYDNCIWRAELTPPQDWDPGPTFDSPAVPFTVLQSTMLDLETLEQLVARIREWFASNGRLSPI